MNAFKKYLFPTQDAHLNVNVNNVHNNIKIPIEILYT